MTERCEAAIQAEILIAITALPDSMFWRSNTGKARNASGHVIRFGVPGQPDILGTFRGRAVGIEVKSAKGTQRREQKLWQAQWIRGGGIYVLARSLDDVMQALGLSVSSERAA